MWFYIVKELSDVISCLFELLFKDLIESFFLIGSILDELE